MGGAGGVGWGGGKAQTLVEGTRALPTKVCALPTKVCVLPMKVCALPTKPLAFIFWVIGFRV